MTIVHAKPPKRDRRPRGKPQNVLGSLAVTAPVMKRQPAAPAQKAADAKSALPSIVTAHRPGRSWHPPVPDLSREELVCRADAADEMWREMVRRAKANR